MKFMSPVNSLALAFLALAAVCAGSVSAQEIKAGGLVLSHAWARATPGGAEVGGGYLTIENRMMTTSCPRRSCCPSRWPRKILISGFYVKLLVES